MRKPLADLKIFKERRKKLALKMQKNSALIVSAHPEMIRNNDVHHGYRADSNLFYLTGFEEPESVLVFRPGMNPETTLFVRKKDVEMETWTGFRFGPEGTQSVFEVDKTYVIDDFEKEAPGLLKDCESVYYRLFKNTDFDPQMAKVLLAQRRAKGRTGLGLLPIMDADQLIGELRLFKSEYELEQIRKAADISAEAHIAAMKFTRPGVSERQIHGVLLYNMMLRGAAREGYGSIVAAGNNATTLHYEFNDDNCQEGQLLLIDAGAEYNYYSGDITRTFPVNGKFTDAQAEVYEGVLKIQKHIISMIKPGLTFKEIHDTATQMLTDLMLDLGLVTGRKEDILAAAQQKKYYPHGAGHWLGMDVHDAGLYVLEGDSRKLEPGMLFTIEPGLYIPETDTTAATKLRGIGIRIEDNILVTEKGYENLTEKAPKEIADIEKIMRG